MHLTIHPLYMVFFITSFFKSHNAFATASTVISTLIEFITGIYVPIGSLPEPVQLVIKLFPTSHSGALMRQVLLEDTLATSFSWQALSYLDTFKLDMGVTYKLSDSVMSPTTSILILLGSAIVFYLLAILNISRK